MFDFFLAGFMSTATHDVFEAEQQVNNLQYNQIEIKGFLNALKCDDNAAVMFGQILGSLMNSDTLAGWYDILGWVDLEDDEVISKRELLKGLAESLELV